MKVPNVNRTGRDLIWMLCHVSSLGSNITEYRPRTEHAECVIRNSMIFDVYYDIVFFLCYIYIYCESFSSHAFC